MPSDPKKPKPDIDKCIIDQDAVTDYSLAIEKVIVDTFDKYDQNTKLELLVVLVSFAAQISMELNLSEEDLIYILYKLYGNVQKEMEKSNKKEEGEIPELYNKIYKKKLN